MSEASGKPIDFYFDFSSPYGYLTANRIDEIADRHGREVAWRPFLLGAAFPSTGSQPLVEIPMKGDYARRDMPRTAARYGIDFVFPEGFPMMTVAAARAFYWQHDSDPAKAKDLAKAIYHAAFGEGRNISGAETVLEIAGTVGIDEGELKQALQDQDLKARTKKEVEAALERGVFGSPFIFVDGEPFWGNDRLDDVEEWMRTGGWDY